MKAHSPCYLWWPKDYLTDLRTRQLNLTEHGVYRTLLDFCWLEGFVPRACNRLIGMTEAEEDLVDLDHIFDMLLEPLADDPELYYSPRIERIREEMLSKQKKLQDAGRAGGLASAAARRSLNGGSSGATPPSSDRGTMENLPVPVPVPSTLPPSLPKGTAVPGALIDRLTKDKEPDYDG
jgi:hypothetical protein